MNKEEMKATQVVRMYSNEWSRLTPDQVSIILNNHNELPIKIGKIAKELGITVKRATLQAGISGEIKELDGQVTTRINRHDVKERQRFTLAHEIAHFLIHRDLIGDGIVDDILYRSVLSDELEQQANRLGADILMPWNLVKERLKLLEGKRIETKIETLAKEFEVSITAMQIRLGKA
ncbi:ImmA/IrrE family metallo-endopeptidase [Pseudoalteromonas sp. McH1-42]|uniref:ImmA/IrrE family metallo-endopeptidase n=1 Tax=Pseudoalteromonas sp. McH1-42 TaxID=2917752 RepID=UPI001EF4A125|nr:ImmA/IrrE family metallo-endopeptidase [Pseudoalteromonas sp. McH1-42]MCG7563657.1 ImmA/IrrE family metallo-endopeptidase [Pseudoalteromonas sp. McH1-42]